MTLGTSRLRTQGFSILKKTDENLTTISDELFADIDMWLNETPPEKKRNNIAGSA